MSISKYCLVLEMLFQEFNHQALPYKHDQQIYASNAFSVLCFCKHYVAFDCCVEAAPA